MFFEFPVNVMCFNRPQYLEKLLLSLLNQDLPLKEELLFFWVDGYIGSKDESLGRVDSSEKIIELIYKYFPSSNVVPSTKNLGIARNYGRAEFHSFEVLKVQSAFFLEEDLELSAKYFSSLHNLDLLVNLDSDISHISVSGDIPKICSEIDSTFQTFGHSWGYLLRSWHYFERRQILNQYLELSEGIPYFQRDLIENKIYEFFYSRGILIAGTTQDAIKDGVRNYFGRIAITTADILASNIGEVGEHAFESTIDHQKILTKNPRILPKKILDLDKKRLLVDSWVKTANQTYINLIRNTSSQNELLNLRLEASNLRLEASNLKDSLSWRITFPLRLIKSNILKILKFFKN